MRPYPVSATQTSAGFQMRQGCVCEPEAFGLVTSQVAEHSIGRLDETLKHGAPLRGLEVQLDASLAAVERLEEEAIGPAVTRRDVAGHVAAASRVFDLDDLRAEICEIHGPERPGPVLLNGQDSHTG